MEQFPKRFSVAGKVSLTMLVIKASNLATPLSSSLYLYLLCSFCAEKWDGSALVMGTMYSFDIFAAMPCCTERLKVSAPFKT
jgi:hypothetical protein